MIELKRLDVCVRRRSGEADLIDGHLFFQLDDAYLLVTEDGRAYVSRDYKALARTVRILDEGEEVVLCG